MKQHTQIAELTKALRLPAIRRDYARY